MLYPLSNCVWDYGLFRCMTRLRIPYCMPMYANLNTIKVLFPKFRYFLICSKGQHQQWKASKFNGWPKQWWHLANNFFDNEKMSFFLTPSIKFQKVFQVLLFSEDQLDKLILVFWEVLHSSYSFWPQRSRISRSWKMSRTSCCLGKQCIWFSL